jgi:hypothetical protein
MKIAEVSEQYSISQDTLRYYLHWPGCWRKNSGSCPFRALASSSALRERRNRKCHVTDTVVGDRY